MRFLILLLIHAVLCGSIFSQESRRTKQKSAKTQIKKGNSSKKTGEESLGLSKEDRKLVYQSWVSEETLFPSETEEKKEETTVKKPPTTTQIPEYPKPKPLDPGKEGAISKFFSENLKMILVGLAILAFAVYRLRNMGISSPTEPRGRIFSKFRDK